jgi:arylsulfatase A-like enzyme
MLIQEEISGSEALLKLYGAIDDDLKALRPHLQTKQRPRDPRGSTLSLSAAEVLTIVVWGAWRGLTDKAMGWIRQQKAIAPDKPFFVYFAPGATHAPHHVPKDWIAKYKGKFDQGWDKVREETFARQKQRGVIPPECELTPRPEEIPA